MAKAAATRSIKNDHQKEFLRIFNVLCGRYNRWEVWQDFVILTATTFSFTTDKANAPERMKTFQAIAKKHTEDEMRSFDAMLNEVVEGMTQQPDQDFLGSLYMLCELGNEHTGQFFTPYDVCKCMAMITMGNASLDFSQGFVSVSDPACGAGATLLALANILKEKNVYYHTKVLFVGQDIDYIVGLMCYIQLSLMGCAGYVVIGDTISEPSWSYDGRGLLPGGPQNRIWYTPFYFTDVWVARQQFAKMDLLFRKKKQQPSTEPADLITQNADISSKIEKKPIKSAIDEAQSALNETKTGQLTFF